MFLKRLIAKIKGQLMIRFDIEEREDGYLYVSSPDLKGFTLLLEPSQTKSVIAMASAINEPLMAYYSAYQSARSRAQDKPDEKDRFEVIDIGRGSGSTLTAVIGRSLANFCH
jgi:hypothetical protein